MNTQMSSTASDADGRIARTQATRLEILAATRRLILSGESEPTAKQIALSAGITTRTLFRHFPDMNTLYRSFVEVAEAGATQVMDEPFPQDIQEAAQGGWLELLAVVCDRRARVYESLLPLYASTLWGRYREDAAFRASQHRGILRRRKRLEQILPKRVYEDSVLFEAIDAVLSIDYWLSLRRDQGLSPKRAANVIKRAVEKLSS